MWGSGEPVFRFNGKQQVATRVSLSWKLGRPLKLNALHLCDVQLCVNPDHMYEGTQAENMLDRNDRNRIVGGGPSRNFGKLQRPRIYVV
jgi:hypothetical protein